MSISALMAVQLAMQYGPTIVGLIQQARSNDDIATKLTTMAPEVGQLVGTLGAQLFPKSSDALQKVGGAIAAFDTNTTAWVQKACNDLLANDAGFEPLTVDGRYGPRTRAAVEAVQRKLGVKLVDGLAGKVTQAAISFALQNPVQLGKPHS